MALSALGGCTQETRHRISRSVLNYTGTHGVQDVYAEEKLVNRFVGIDKISIATATTGKGERPLPFRLRDL